MGNGPQIVQPPAGFNMTTQPLPSGFRLVDPAQVEMEFQQWYKRHADKWGLDPDPDDPQHFYDYRSAWASGAQPDDTGHLPSTFKNELHPNLIVDGKDTRTGQPAFAASHAPVTPMSLFDKALDYLGLQKTFERITTESRTKLATVSEEHKEFMAAKTTPDPITAWMYKHEDALAEVGRVMYRGVNAASLGLMDIAAKTLPEQKVGRPETTAGAIAGATAELGGFLLGPLSATKFFMGGRLAPTKEGLVGLAQLMIQGAAELGVASGLSSIIPSLLEHDEVKEASLSVVEHTAMGAVIGALFPTFAVLPTKPIRVAVGLAVMDMLRSDKGLFTIDDVVSGLYNGTISSRELAERTYGYLIDAYFASKVPSMKRTLEGLKHNKLLKDVAGLNPEEVMETILTLEKEGLIPGSDKRRRSKVDDIAFAEMAEAAKEAQAGERAKQETKREFEGVETTALEEENMTFRKLMEQRKLTEEEGKRYSAVQQEQVWRTKERRGKGEEVQEEGEGEGLQAMRGGGGNVQASFFDLPELVELSKQLMEGKLPIISTTLRGKLSALGAFDPKSGKILLDAKIFENPKQVMEVLAHEIGHLADWLPDKSMKRGNLLGRIASLRDYMLKQLEEYPGATEKPITDWEKRTFQWEAEQRAKQAEQPDVTIIEEIRREVPRFEEVGVKSEDILAIWRDLTAKEKFPAIYEIVARMNTAQKKAIIKKAMQGIVDDAFASIRERVQTGTETITETVERVIRRGRKATPEEIKAVFEDIVREEIVRRHLWEESVIRQELEALSFQWRPFDPSVATPGELKYRKSGVELYADSISVLLNDPARLKREAPKFYEAFFNWLERKPEVDRVYNEILAEIKAGTSEASAVKRLRDSFDEADKTFYDSVQNKTSMADDLKTFFIDRHHWLYSRLHRLGEKNLPPGDNPRYRVEKMDYHVSEAEGYMRDIYSQIIRTVEDSGADMQDFREYVYHNRVINDRSKIANPQGWYPERSRTRLTEMRQQDPARFAAMELAWDNFWNMRQTAVVDRVERLGIFGDSLVQVMKNRDRYATFSVEKYFNRKYGANVGPRIMEQVGTLENILDPFAATVMKDISIMRAIGKIEAARSVIGMFKTYFPTEIQKAPLVFGGRGMRVQQATEKGQWTIYDMRGGRLTGYNLPEEVAVSFERNPGEARIIARVLGATMAPFRRIFTELNPGFWLFNVHRDYLRSVKNLPGTNIVNFAKYWLGGIKPAFRSSFSGFDVHAQEMLKEGTLLSVQSLHGMRRDDMQIERMLKQFHMSPGRWETEVNSPIAHFLNYVTNIGRIPINFMENISKGLERVPKIASDTYLKEKFPGMPDEVRQHIIRSQAGSPDFLRRGTGYELYNNILMFSNAIKEGYRGDYAASSNSPASYMWKTAKYNFLPKMLMYAAAVGIMGEAIKRVFDRMTEYDKTNYIDIPLGETDSGKAIYFRLPQDETGRLLGGMFWKVMDGNFEPIRGGLADFMAGQAPNLHPLFGLMVDTVSYFSGNNPYDNFRSQHAIPELVWQADDIRTKEMFVKYLMNNAGSGLIYRFQTTDDLRVKTTLEKVLGYPILSNILGRFIKVTDQGLKEGIKREVLIPIDKTNARRVLDFREAIRKGVTGEPLVDKDVTAIMQQAIRDPDVIPRNLLVQFGRRYGTAYTEMYLTASTKEEKIAIIQYMLKKEQRGKEK